MSVSSARIRALRRLACILVLALVTVAGTVGMTHAQELHLSNLVLNNFEGKIRVRFGVDVSQPERLQQSVESGERLALECRATLARKREYLWSRELASATFHSDLRRLRTGDFVVSLPGQGSMADRELGPLFHKAWNEILLDLGPWDRLERGQTYVLSLELSLKRLDVSPWLSKGLFFWSFDAAPSVSYQLDFTY